MHEITARTRDALRIVLDIAWYSRYGVVRRKDIGIRQSMTTDQLDMILGRIKRKKIIISVRGRDGGFFLGKDPSEISVWDIVEAVEGNKDDLLSNNSKDDFTVSMIQPSIEAVWSGIKKALEEIYLTSLLKKDGSSVFLDSINDNMKTEVFSTFQ